MIYVVMSTYNGERYIRQQLDSLIEQTYNDLRILIRDDGSKDSTVDILQEYQNTHDNIDFYVGNNIGVVDSFYDLLSKVPDDADYVATCDQDDVWLKDKLETAVEALSNCSGAALYCGRPQLVDEKLNVIEDRLAIVSPRISFGNAMIENICTGCTMVINRQLYDIIDNRWPQQSLMHDWWIYQVAVCFGTVIYDDTPHIYYRQHGDNEVGKVSKRGSLIKKQVRSINRFRGKYTAQMKEFLEAFTPDGENGELARLMVGTRDSVKCRWKILVDRRIYRQGRWDTLIFKGLLFFGIL